MHRLLASLFFVAALSRSAAADTPVRFSGNVGLGLGFGFWTQGLAAKYFINESNSLEGVIGLWRFGAGAYGFGVNADYLREMPSLYEDRSFEIGWCVGGGPSLAGGGGTGAVGIHATGGIELNLEEFPLDVSLEYKPGLILAPVLFVDAFDVALLIRVYPF